jgi:hypothetical protein
LASDHFDILDPELGAGLGGEWTSYRDLEGMIGNQRAARTASGRQ